MTPKEKKMETVGIRQFKAHLGKYVGKAQAGKQDVRSGADSIRVRFSSFDRLLNRAAEVAGFEIPETEEPGQPEAS